jgi:SAM-dependent methyltransferase
VNSIAEKINQLPECEDCPLCGHKGKTFYRSKRQLFYCCGNCEGIFLAPPLYPTKESESARYLEHNNDPADIRYRNFVSPIVETVSVHFNTRHKGLDYGAGYEPIVAIVLKEKGFSPDIYDPFFHPDATCLSGKYDYITACEVVEHFHNPSREFKSLRELLKPGGKLILMTHLYESSILFDNWYYKNDRTHVFIYRKKSMEYIREWLHFETLIMTNRLVVFGA